MRAINYLSNSALRLKGLLFDLIQININAFPMAFMKQVGVGPVLWMETPTIYIEAAFFISQ